MAISTLERRAWKPYFDRLSAMLAGKAVEIDVESLELGAQVDADWVSLVGLMYEPQDDMVSVMVEGLDHMIRHPREVFIDTGLTGVASMEVIDADQQRHIIKLREPLQLPAPPPH